MSRKQKSWYKACRALAKQKTELILEEWRLECIGYLYKVHSSGHIQGHGYNGEHWLSVKAWGWLSGTDAAPIITQTGLDELSKYHWGRWQDQ